MAMGVQPVDGLIHRLLQQNAKPSAGLQQQENRANPDSDRLSISATSKEAASNPVRTSNSGLPARPGEKALESHLLNLYRSNDKYGG